LFLAREIASGKKIKRGDEEWKLTRLFAVAHEVKLDVPLLVER